MRPWKSKKQGERKSMKIRFSKPLKLIHLLFAFYATSSFATPMANKPLLDYEGCGYVTPTKLIQSNQKVIEAEGGFFTKVPLNYKNPSAGTTEIYSYFSHGFDEQKPTFVIFTGGPGQNSHLEMSPRYTFFGTLGFNVLMFDQRGIGFSRLQLESQARDARNFSSEANARDLLSILDKLKIQKISVYGTSYGTVPATIFASLFPERTNSLVLEGVVYNGWNGVMGGRNVRYQIQKFYNSLSSDLKDRIDYLIHTKSLDEYWFPMMVMSFMMESGTSQFSQFNEAMEEALVKRNLNSDQDVSHAFAELSAKLPVKNRTKEASEILIKWYKLLNKRDHCQNLVDSDDVNRLLMLKEFDAGLPHVTSVYALKNREIVPVPGVNYASDLKIFNHMEFSSYSANQYPVQVPTFYIQGTADGATPAPGAALHYKNAAKGPAQLLYFRKSGHMPFSQALFELNEAEYNWQSLQNVFANLLNSGPFTCQAKSEVENQFPSISISLASKNFPGSGSKISRCQLLK
jgi:proline iminopeptidase